MLWYVENDGKFWNSTCAMFVRESVDATLFTLHDTAWQVVLEHGGEIKDCFPTE